MERFDYLTLDWLNEREACFSGKEEFQKRFGQQAKTLDCLKVIHELGKSYWEGWLLTQNTELTLVLIDLGADIHAHNGYAFFWATENNHFELVKLLLEKGADIRAHDDYALCWAARNNHHEMVELLLEKGANIHAYNGFTLRWAEKNKHF